MWTILVAAGVALLSSCSTGHRQQSIVSNQADTILIYQKDTALVAGRSPIVLQCAFKDKASFQNNHLFKTLLLLDEPVIVAAPDGVYEVYVTGQYPNQLAASTAAFASVLDLYSFTSPGAKQQLETDITAPIKKILLQQGSLNSLYITLRFGPSKLADGTYASAAGEVHFKRVKIIQLKN